MGLSILIPVFNFDVSSLIQSLAGQIERTGKECEILILDDGSDRDHPVSIPPLQNISFVSLYRNEKNEGRMMTRQKLADLARFEYLLFLDCDSEIIKEGFVAIYFEWIQKEAGLVCGGRVYAETPPDVCEYRLHWKYGRKRESKQGKSAFMSNNFLVKKEIFLQLDFSLQLPGYGHEDTWWGIQFEQADIACKYVQNPVLHANLENAGIYLDKSEQALTNILRLEKHLGKNLLRKHIRIFRWYLRLKGTGFSNLFLVLEKQIHAGIRRNLLSCRPNLLFFDWYRLALLIRLAKQNNSD